MKIEDIEVGKQYYVVLAGSTYLGRVIAKSDAHVIWTRYGPAEGHSLLPQWFVTEYKPQPSLWSRVRSIFSPDFSEP